MRLAIYSVLYFLLHLLASNQAKATATFDWPSKSIEAEKARSKIKIITRPIIAIIDTGMDMQHPDLKGALWQNPGETGLDKFGNDNRFNKIDDDKNGFVDDVHGWNFAEDNNKLGDNNGHGTHIAGIIAAQKTRVQGLWGIAPHSRIMILKYFKSGATGKSNILSTIKAIDYAIKMGANIINYSSGGRSFSQKEFMAISRAQNKNILFIAAAGNESSNSDKIHYYPAGYKLENIISVTAFDQQSRILNSSNFGSSTVDIAGPGKQIYSTLPGGGFGFMTGTSQATAFITGVAALLLSSHKTQLLPEQIKAHLLATGRYDKNLLSKTSSHTRINALRALRIKSQNYNPLLYPPSLDHTPNPLMFDPELLGASDSTNITSVDP